MYVLQRENRLVPSLLFRLYSRIYFFSSSRGPKPRILLCVCSFGKTFWLVHDKVWGQTHIQQCGMLWMFLGKAWIGQRRVKGFSLTHRSAYCRKNNRLLIDSIDSQGRSNDTNKTRVIQRIITFVDIEDSWSDFSWLFDARRKHYSINPRKKIPIIFRWFCRW